jgi:pimeloyl-ACP methyl ester carboxylesterase
MPSMILSGGGTLAYTSTGSGPPLILVHGSPGEGRSWSRVASRLTGHFRILTPDLPGYGGSDPLPIAARGRTAAMGAAVGELIATCGERIWLCGHSYGGNVALHAAISRAERIRGLTLFEPVFFRSLYLARDEDAFESAARFFSAYADRVTTGEPELISEMIDYWFGPGAFARMPASAHGFLIGSAARNGADVRASFAEELTVEDVIGFIKPLVIAYGDNSPAIVPAIVRALARFVQQARIEVVAGADHGMLDSHPKEVADLILAGADV